MKQMIPRIENPKRTCLSCYWFQFPSPSEYEEAERLGRLRPLGNRGCKYPSAIAFREERCWMWRNQHTLWERFLIFLHIKKPKRRSIVR